MWYVDNVDNIIQNLYMFMYPFSIGKIVATYLPLLSYVVQEWCWIE